MTAIDIDPEAFGTFGVAEGHRASIEGPSFVELSPAVTPAGLTSTPDDRVARVVVGKKGSGKTVYLRRFQAAAAVEASVYASRVEPKTPLTHRIVTFCKWYGSEDLTERWSEVWGAAILRAACSHILYSPLLKEYGMRPHRRQLETVAERLMPEVTTPRSPYNQIDELIAEHESATHLDRTLSSGAWGNLEYWLTEILREAPPMFFYLDAVDEEYAAAPNYWMRCQKGLFYQVMRFLRDPELGGRLHVVIAVRENVFASVLRSEHATRYRTDPHIRILAWDRPAVGYLLGEKLARLKPSELVNPRSGKNLEGWLGLDAISNTARGVDEPVVDYLLRHTRLLPRDVVLLGNALGVEIQRARNARRTSVAEGRIREVVSQVAAWCGSEQLAVCGNQIAGDSVPSEPGDGFHGSQEYVRSLTDKIGRIIRGLGEDQFESLGIDLLDEAGRQTLGQDIDLPTVLWQNGLLGFRDQRTGTDEWIFHGVEDFDRFHLPLERERYALHPCLLDTLGLTSAGRGTEPVKPWRRQQR